jgi:hypothetical protein
MQIAIPKQYRGSLVRLVMLSPQHLARFVDSLKRAKPEGSLYGLADRLSDQIPEMDSDEIYGILSMLASLYRYRESFGTSVKDLVDGFIATAKEETKGTGIAPVFWAKLREFLREIFRLEGSLGITAKATEIAHEHERIFCPASTRILTDVRPIFLSSPSNTPAAAIIQHNLKIAYHSEQGKTSEFFVTLSEDGIDALMYLLIRSKRKAESVRKLLKSSGIKLMASDEDGA